MAEAQQQQQRYRVIEKLASGGMAEVFLAESAGLEGFKKRVAIKRVLPHLSEKKTFISMFLDEARLSAHLSHSNCVQVFDIGVGDNAYFIVMEYVEGADLKAVLEMLKKQGRAMSMEEAVFIAVKICEGLCYAHELTDSDNKPLGVVHRDMSPPNVLITRHGEIKIVDFGLAKASSQLEQSEPGIIKGKFSYLSPEAALGKEVDHRTDIFAVGIILWEMLAGRRLFLGDTDFATVKLVQQAAIPPLSKINTKVTPALDTIVNRVLAADPAQRFQSARELAISLTDFLYKNGRAVGSFGIASLVEGAMRERQRVRAVQQHSIIDKLIQEALFEFTSLQEAKSVAGTASQDDDSDAGASPLSLARFGQMSDWSKEISIQNAPQPPSQNKLRQTLAAMPSNVLEGNLSALEDAEAGALGFEASAPSTARAGGGSVAPRRASADAAGADTGPDPDEMALTKKKSGGKIVLLLAVLAAAGAAGAYFAGLFGSP